MRLRLRLAAAGALLALAAVPLTAAAASAHDSLVDAEPAADASASAVDEVTLRFSDAPLGMAGSNVIQVVGPDGRYYETGCPTLSGPLVTSPVALGAPGDYRVRWRVVSSDGHPVAGEYGFTYRPEGDPAAPADGSAEPRCGETPSASSGQGEGDASGAAVPAGVPAGVWTGVAVGGAVIAAVAVAAWLIVRRPASSGSGIESDPPTENPTQRKERA